MGRLLSVAMGYNRPKAAAYERPFFDPEALQDFSPCLAIFTRSFPTLMSGFGRVSALGY